MMTNLTGTCQYSTMCGWCTKWDKKCDRKIGCGNEKQPIESEANISVHDDYMGQDIFKNVIECTRSYEDAMKKLAEIAKGNKHE